MGFIEAKFKTLNTNIPIQVKAVKKANILTKGLYLLNTDLYLPFTSIWYTSQDAKHINRAKHIMPINKLPLSGVKVLSIISKNNLG